MGFEKPAKAFKPEFDIRISNDSTSASDAKLVLSFGEVLFEVPTNLHTHVKPTEIRLLSSGFDIAPDEIDLLRAHALSAAQEFVQSKMLEDFA